MKSFLKKKFLGLLLLVSTVLVPQSAKQEVFRHHLKPLVFQFSKNSPARLALHEISESSQVLSRWAHWERRDLQSVDLNSFLQPTVQTPTTAVDFETRKVTLAQSLTDAQRARFEQAQERSKTIETDWDMPTTAQLFAEKLAEIQSQTMLDRVRGTGQQESQVTVRAELPNGQIRDRSALSEGVGVQAVRPDRPQKQKQFLISGPLKVNRSAPLLAGSRIDVSWIDDEIEKISGQVTGSPNYDYSIQVPELRGVVVARMLDSRGNEVGRGEFRLNSQASSQALASAAIEISNRSSISTVYHPFGTPSPRTSNMTAARARKSATVKTLFSATLEESEADPEGYFEVPQIAQNSFSFLRSESAGNYPTLSLVASGQKIDQELFPNSMVDALISISREFDNQSSRPQNGSVIWGLIKGVPEGAEVEIEGFPEEKALYFNEILIPERRLTRTSKNGYFAFVDLPEGFYSIRAKLGTQLRTANVEVDEKTLSTVEFKFDDPSHQVDVKLFDGFTGDRQTGRVEFQHLPDSLEIEGYAEVSLPAALSLNVARVTPQDSRYVSATYLYSGESYFLHLPLVPADWLQSLQQLRKINMIPGTSLVLGFLKSGDVELSFPHLQQANAQDMIFFDASGAPTEKPVAGGGFVLFNVPEGSQTVTVQSESTGLIQSQVVPIESNSLHILKFSL